MDRGARRSQPLGKRSWIFKYPMTFQITFTILGLGLFFSKPIYDLFLTPRQEVDLSEPPTTFGREREAIDAEKQ